MYFRSSIIIIFCKLKKLDYITDKVYCLITLLNMLSKALDFNFTKRIIYLDKIYRLLPYNYFNTRYARFTKYPLYYIVKYIYKLWNKKKLL